MIKSIDICSDVGESFGNFKVGNDEAVLPLITSANIGCGFHGGDPVTMQRTVDLAAQHNVQIGAHPGYPDLMGFGRREIKLSMPEARAYLLYQLGALREMCSVRNKRVYHIKPHGAYAGMLRREPELARCLVDTLKELPEKLALFLPAPLNYPSGLAEMAKEAGIRIIGEVYLDMKYRNDGSLIIKKVLEPVDPAETAARALRFVKTGELEAETGEILRFEAESICIHGDLPNAPDVLRAIRSELQKAGVRIEAPKLGTD